MWWRFRKRYGNATKARERVDPWLYARADEAMESPSIAEAFFCSYYLECGDGVGRFDLERVKSVDRTKLRRAGECAGREIFYSTELPAGFNGF